MTTEQLYFLSDENDAYGARFRNDVEFWSSKIDVLDKSYKRAKSFSTMMASCGIFLYDHPCVMKTYPNGFYSENTIFVPVDMYDNMLQSEPLAVKKNNINSYWNLTGVMLINFFTKMIEKKYEIEFSPDEKEQILLSATQYSFVEKQLIVSQKQVEPENQLSEKEIRDITDNIIMKETTEYISKMNGKDIINVSKEIFNNKEPVFVSNENIAKLAQQNNLYAAETFKKQNTDSSFIDYALLKNTDMYEKNHPFSQLMGKVKMPAKTIDLLDFDQQTYKDMIINLPFGDAYMVFNAFENLTYNIFKQSKTEEDLIRNISGIWSNFALYTNDDHFQMLMTILHDNFIQKYPYEEDKHITEDVGFKVGSVINDNPSTNNTKRRLIIEGLTEQTNMYATVRTMIYPQKNKTLHI